MADINFDPSKMISLMIDEVAGSQDTLQTAERCFSLAEMLLAFDIVDKARSHVDRAVQIFEDIDGVDSERAVHVREWRDKAFTQDDGEQGHDAKV